MDSLSKWIDQVKHGDELAAAKIWDEFFPDLVRIAHQRLKAAPRRAEDEEDIALSALDSFFRAARRGRFPDLADRDGLWRLLAAMTQRKAVDFIRRALSQKAGGGQVRGESVFQDEPQLGLAQFAQHDLSPPLAAMMAEQVRQRLNQLDDENLRVLARAKLEGCTNEEIAQQMDCSLRTVERRLRLIRTKWQQPD